MALDYQGLKTELAGSHPVSGAYNVDDALAADQLNDFNIAAETPAEEFLRYCLENNHRSNNGEDTQNTNIYGRIKMVAEATRGQDVFEQGGATPPEVTIGQIAAAKTVIALLDSGLAFLGSNAQIDGALTKLQGADAIGPADKTALLALGDNRTNRLLQINFGRDKVNATHVAHARAI